MSKAKCMTPLNATDLLAVSSVVDQAAGESFLSKIFDCRQSMNTPKAFRLGCNRPDPPAHYHSALFFNFQFFIVPMSRNCTELRPLSGPFVHPP
jgi:hypothetical protein